MLTTPSGCRMVLVSMLLLICSTASPIISEGMLMQCSTTSIPRVTSPSASTLVLPFSATMLAAMSSCTYARVSPHAGVRASASQRRGGRDSAKERMEASRALAEAPDLVFNQECLELDHYARALLHRHLIDRVQRREKMGE